MMCGGKAVKGDLMAVMVQCETKHPACVNRETVSTIRKYVSTRRFADDYVGKCIGGRLP